MAAAHSCMMLGDGSATSTTSPAHTAELVPNSAHGFIHTSATPAVKLAAAVRT